MGLFGSSNKATAETIHAFHEQVKKNEGVRWNDYKLIDQLQAGDIKNLKNYLGDEIQRIEKTEKNPDGTLKTPDQKEAEMKQWKELLSSVEALENSWKTGQLSIIKHKEENYEKVVDKTRTKLSELFGEVTSTTQATKPTNGPTLDELPKITEFFKGMAYTLDGKAIKFLNIGYVTPRYYITVQLDEKTQLSLSIEKKGENTYIAVEPTTNNYDVIIDSEKKTCQLISKKQVSQTVTHSTTTTPPEKKAEKEGNKILEKNTAYISKNKILGVVEQNGETDVTLQDYLKNPTQENIKTLQTFLNTEGADPELVLDGSIGTLTLNALRAHKGMDPIKTAILPIGKATVKPKGVRKINNSGRENGEVELQQRASDTNEKETESQKIIEFGKSTIHNLVSTDIISKTNIFTLRGKYMQDPNGDIHIDKTTGISAKFDKLPLNPDLEKAWKELDTQGKKLIIDSLNQEWGKAVTVKRKQTYGGRKEVTVEEKNTITDQGKELIITILQDKTKFQEFVTGKPPYKQVKKDPFNLVGYADGEGVKRGDLQMSVSAMTAYENVLKDGDALKNWRKLRSSEQEKIIQTLNQEWNTRAQAKLGNIQSQKTAQKPIPTSNTETKKADTQKIKAETNNNVIVVQAFDTIFTQYERSPKVLKSPIGKNSKNEPVMKVNGKEKEKVILNAKGINDWNKLNSTEQDDIIAKYNKKFSDRVKVKVTGATDTGTVGTMPGIDTGIVGTMPGIDTGIVGTMPGIDTGIVGTMPGIDTGIVGTMPTSSK